jgi:hypothetical protein
MCDKGQMTLIARPSGHPAAARILDSAFAVPASTATWESTEGSPSRSLETVTKAK